MAIYYVATTGSNGNAGDVSTLPLATVTYACTLVSPDDEIWIAPGIYAEAAVQLVSADVTFRGWGGIPIIYGGAQVAGTWVNHAGNVWKITTVASDPGTIILRSSAAAEFSAFSKGLRMDAVGEVTSDRKFFYDSGATTLYLYSVGNPSTTYYRVDYSSSTGTAGIYSDSAGFYAVGANRCRFERIAVYGYRQHGFGADDATDLTFIDCDHSFNGQDGCGGFNLPNFTYIGGRASWNGTRKARNFGELLPDGDGISLHTGGVGSGSDGFLIRNVHFEGNTKSAVQNIHDSAGLIDRCISVNNQLHFPLSSYSTSPQTCQNSKMTLADDDLGCFGADAGCVGTYRNCTAYGAKTTGVIAVFIINGTINMQNCIVQRFDVGAFVVLGTLNRNDNVWNDVTTLGFTLGASEISSDPLLLGIASGYYGIPRNSPAVGIGTDYSGSGSTHDLAGRKRPSAPSAGAYEAVTAGGPISGGAMMLLLDG